MTTQTADDALDGLSDDDFEAYMAIMLGEPMENVRHWGVDLPLTETERLIRGKEACKLLGISKSTLYRMTSRGDIVKPTRISHRVAGWPMKVLMEWRDQQPGGVDERRRKVANGRLT